MLSTARYPQPQAPTHQHVNVNVAPSIRGPSTRALAVQPSARPLAAPRRAARALTKRGPTLPVKPPIIKSPIASAIASAIASHVSLHAGICRRCPQMDNNAELIRVRIEMSGGRAGQIRSDPLAIACRMPTVMPTR